ncbi:MAG: hypothetical protein V3V00_05755 [Saprospiraceae bacterium]
MYLQKPCLISKIISIGNSKDVRLPKSFVSDWEDDQELIIEKHNDTIIIIPKKNNRENWVEQIMACEGPKKEEEYFPNEFDEKEWTW